MAALTRREALAGGVAGAAWLAVPAWARKRPPGLARGVRFAQGVAAGAPRMNGISLWTRADGLDPSSPPAPLLLQVASDPGFRHVVHQRRVLADPARDFTVQARVRTPRLRPAHEYWYRFESADGSSGAGHFRTLPPRDSAQPVRIGFWTCQAWIEGYYSAHGAMAAEDLDLVVCLGDFIYEYGGSSPLPDRADPVGTARTLDAYRAKYRLYRSDPALRALQAAHASYVMWDDHEVTNNYWREGAGDGAGFAARKAAAYRAWFEHQPVPVIDGTRIYRSVRVGRHVDVFLLDERQYRDQQPCGDSILTPCPDAKAPGRAFLGARQKAWLQDGLRRSSAPWKVLANGDMMMGLDQPAPGTPKFVDTWDGYQAERAELVSSWLRDGVRDVVVMTGDDHDNYAGVVTTTGHADGTPGAVEFVVPSMTSQNTSEILQSNEATATASESDTRAVNAHLAYVDQRHHGYCLLEATADDVRVSFRHVDSVRDRSSAVRTARAFRVRRGSVALESLV
jgi:alkaline phosphatase D